MQRALEKTRELKQRADQVPRRRAIANTIPAGIRRSICRTCMTVSEAITRSALERKESRGGALPR